jgi:fructose-bisphosphate aldolase class II
MPLVPMRILLDHAAEFHYGIAAFNVNNMEQIQAILEAARETQSPVIIQASRGARQYTNDLFLRHLLLAAVQLYPEIPVAMHQDHGDVPETCYSAIRQGFTSVMMDGSLWPDPQTPASQKPKLVAAPFDHNVRVTREVVQRAHLVGVTVEGELGCLGGIEDGHGAGLDEKTVQEHLTDPAQAEQFVAETGVDALAVAIGTSHGAYKFKEKPTGDVLRMDRIEEIHRRLPKTHLVMHGSSSVPEELQEIIRTYGGFMEPTYGVPIEQIQRGIRHGVRKINVDTDNRLAMTGAIRKIFACEPAKFDPREYLGPARDAMKQVCIDRMVAFGQAGQAGKIRVRSCSEMIEFYGA